LDHVQANTEGKHITFNAVPSLGYNFWSFVASSPTKVIQLLICEKELKQFVANRNGIGDEAEIKNM
jgi:hypothetical protein